MRMKDKGIVINTQGDLAQVKVDCFAACDACAAQNLCLRQNQALGQGLLSVKNSLHADPGDEVVIEIPERHYTRALIVLFVSLLISALAGLTAGYASALFLPFSSSQGSLLGFFLGIGAGMTWVVHYFRKHQLDNIYPDIIHITIKGDTHE